MKISRVLIICLIATITSGCAGNDLVEPLCYPLKPVLEDITPQEQMDIRAYVGADVLRRIGWNDKQLKEYIRLMVELTDSHNQQFEATCEVI
jgi:hypothetical protein